MTQVRAVIEANQTRLLGLWPSLREIARLEVLSTNPRKQPDDVGINKYTLTHGHSLKPRDIKPFVDSIKVEIASGSHIGHVPLPVMLEYDLPSRRRTLLAQLGHLIILYSGGVKNFIVKSLPVTPVGSV